METRSFCRARRGMGRQRVHPHDGVLPPRTRVQPRVRGCPPGVLRSRHRSCPVALRPAFRPLRPPRGDAPRTGRRPRGQYPHRPGRNQRAPHLHRARPLRPIHRHGYDRRWLVDQGTVHHSLRPHSQAKLRRQARHHVPHLRFRRGRRTGRSSRPVAPRSRPDHVHRPHPPVHRRARGALPHPRNASVCSPQSARIVLD